MKTACPKCKQQFNDMPDKYIGQKLQCPVCRTQFVARPLANPGAGSGGSNWKKRLSWTLVILLILAVGLTCGIHFARPYYTYKLELKAVEIYQQQKTENYKLSLRDLRSLVIKAKNNRCPVYASAAQRLENLQELIRAYNPIAQKLEMVMIDAAMREELINVLDTSNKGDGYSVLLQVESWRKAIEEKIGTFETL